MVVVPSITHLVYHVREPERVPRLSPQSDTAVLLEGAAVAP
jgi:hypothetical protein